METSLHRSLKERYATGGDGRPEVAIRGFRIDAVDDAGRLVEVQSGPLGPLRGKLHRLLPDHRVRIVKPVVLRRRLVRRLRSRRPGCLHALQPEARCPARRLRRLHRRGEGLPARQPRD